MGAAGLWTPTAIADKIWWQAGLPEDLAFLRESGEDMMFAVSHEEDGPLTCIPRSATGCYESAPASTSVSSGKISRRGEDGRRSARAPVRRQQQQFHEEHRCDMGILQRDLEIAPPADRRARYCAMQYFCIC